MDALDEYLHRRAESTKVPLEVLRRQALTRCQLDSHTSMRRLDQLVEQMMVYNAQQPKEKVWGITASRIMRVARLNIKTVRNYLEANAEVIKAHHEAVGIEEPRAHNQKMKGTDYEDPY